MSAVHVCLLVLAFHMVLVSAGCPLGSNFTRVSPGLTTGSISPVPPFPSAVSLSFGSCGSAFPSSPAAFYSYERVHRALPTWVYLCNATNPTVQLQTSELPFSSRQRVWRPPGEQAWEGIVHDSLKLQITSPSARSVAFGGGSVGEHCWCGRGPVARNDCLPTVRRSFFGLWHEGVAAASHLEE